MRLWRTGKGVLGVNRRSLVRRLQRCALRDPEFPQDVEAIAETTCCLYYHVMHWKNTMDIFYGCVFIACKLFDEMEGLYPGQITQRVVPMSIVRAEKEICAFFEWRLPLRAMGLIK